MPIMLSAQAPGTLDSSFATDGKLVLPDLGQVAKLVQQPSGRILVATSNDTAGVILRLMNDGSIDSSFAQFGELVLPIMPFLGPAMQADGRFLLATHIGGTTTVWRYGPDGVIDSTYGVNGQMNFEPGVGIGMMEVQWDGKAVFTGSRPDGPSSDALVIRATTTGALDPTFSNGGVLSFPPMQVDLNEWIYSTTHGLSCLPTGEIAIELRQHIPTPPGFNAACLSIVPDGTEYTYIGDGGPYIIPTPLGVTSNLYGAVMHSWITEMPEDHTPLVKVYTAGTLNANSILWSGSPAANAFFIGSLGSDASGRFLIPGWWTPSAEPSRFMLARTLPNSPTLDTLFDGDGRVQVTFDPVAQAAANSVCSQADGKVLVGGWTMVDGLNRFALARLFNIPDPRCLVSTRVFLGGAYDMDDQLMRDDLRIAGLIPATDPYTLLGLTSPDGAIFHPIQQGVLDSADSTAIVDWVWLDLLSAADPSVIVAARPALVRRDGMVVDIDGHSPVDMNCGAGNYFLRVRHRNHLSATVSDTLSLGAVPVTVDLTSPATHTFGTDAQKEVDGVRMLWPGDVNWDGLVKYTGAANDRDQVLNVIDGNDPVSTTSGYYGADVNLDGVVKYMGAANDRDPILQTVGGLMPTAVRAEQGP